MPKFDIPSNLVKLELTWPEFKKYLDGTYKFLNLQHTEFTVTPTDSEFQLTFYQIIAIDESILYVTELEKKNQDKSGDQIDFETNWLSKSNKQMLYIDNIRGAIATKPAIHKFGFTKCPIAFYFDMGDATVETKHQPLSAHLSKSYDTNKKCTRIEFTVPFTNGIDIEGSEFGIASPEDKDAFRAWIEHPSYPGVNQGYLIHSYIIEANKKNDLIMAGPTCSFVPYGMKLIFEYYSMTTNVDKHMTVNLISWLNLTAGEKVLYTMPLE